MDSALKSSTGQQVAPKIRLPQGGLKGARGGREGAGGSPSAAAASPRRRPAPLPSLTAAVGDVPAAEPLPLGPVEQPRALEEKRRGEDVTPQRGQQVQSGRHPAAENPLRCPEPAPDEAEAAVQGEPLRERLGEPLRERLPLRPRSRTARPPPPGRQRAPCAGAGVPGRARPSLRGSARGWRREGLGRGPEAILPPPRPHGRFVAANRHRPLRSPLPVSFSVVLFMLLTVLEQGALGKFNSLRRVRGGYCLLGRQREVFSTRQR